MSVFVIIHSVYYESSWIVSIHATYNGALSAAGREMTVATYLYPHTCGEWKRQAQQAHQPRVSPDIYWHDVQDSTVLDSWSTSNEGLEIQLFRVEP